MGELRETTSEWTSVARNHAGQHDGFLLPAATGATDTVNVES